MEYNSEGYIIDSLGGLPGDINNTAYTAPYIMANTYVLEISNPIYSTDFMTNISLGRFKLIRLGNDDNLNSGDLITMMVECLWLGNTIRFKGQKWGQSNNITYSAQSIGNISSKSYLWTVVGY